MSKHAQQACPTLWPVNLRCKHLKGSYKTVQTECLIGNHHCFSISYEVLVVIFVQGAHKSLSQSKRFHAVTFSLSQTNADSTEKKMHHETVLLPSVLLMLVFSLSLTLCLSVCVCVHTLRAGSGALLSFGRPLPQRDAKAH